MSSCPEAMGKRNDPVREFFSIHPSPVIPGALRLQATLPDAPTTDPSNLCHYKSATHSCVYSQTWLTSIYLFITPVTQAVLEVGGTKLGRTVR
jgi:hypothetical protein